MVFILYARRKHELSIQDSCIIMWGCRVVIPPAGRETVLDNEHEGRRFGISKMKSHARGFVGGQTWIKK